MLTIPRNHTTPLFDSPLDGLEASKGEIELLWDGHYDGRCRVQPGGRCFNSVREPLLLKS